LRTVAPAKINWTLEVLGKRDDGYHEIRSVMQTIDLCDELWAERAEVSRFETVEGKPLAADDLIVRAAKALQERIGRDLPVRIRVEKRIPVASGLGGGSSDAAAVLRLLNELYVLGLSQEEMASIGATVGSDVPFFVYGGTALVEGRGERVSKLPDAAGAWLTVVVPDVQVADKTPRMYARLVETDFTAGLATDKVVHAISSGVGIGYFDLFNVFDRHVFEVFGLRELADGICLDNLRPVHVIGSGPAMFAYSGGEAARMSAADSAAAYAEAYTIGTADIFIVGCIGASLATSVANGKSGSPH
jgi:4-diphosphocytidyl-2-C-methyl-D-erythritol kinase